MYLKYFFEYLSQTIHYYLLTYLTMVEFHMFVFEDEVKMTPPTIQHKQAHVMADRYQGPSSEMDAINSGDLIRAASPVILILAAVTVLVMCV